MAAAGAAIMPYMPQEKPQVNPPGVETLAMNGEALLPKDLELPFGIAGIHKLVQKFIPSATAAHGLNDQGLKFPVMNGENDIGSCPW